MKLQIKIWKKRDWQLRVTYGGVLLERDQGTWNAMMDRIYWYEKGSAKPFTVNVFGCTNADALKAENIRLKKRDRRMIRWETPVITRVGILTAR